MLFVDARCNHSTCVAKDAYRMVGSCSNCGVEPVLVMFTEAHESEIVECPTCGCQKVYPTRLATEDEIPIGEPAANAKEGARTALSLAAQKERYQ